LDGIKPKPESFTNEGEIAAVALALLSSDALPFEHLDKMAPPADPNIVDAIRADILQGGDPLGDAMCVVRSAKTRRAIGQTLTPNEIVEFMVRKAAKAGEFTVIVDPGIGSGRFLRRAAAMFPTARLIGIDADPLSILISQATLDVLGLAHRTQLLFGDYRNADLPSDRGRTLFIGNPPYVRHHDINSSWKDWYAEASRELGADGASKLAGLHLHFFVRTGQLIKKEDLGMFVAAAEWLDASYGETLRVLLRSRLGGIDITNIAAASEPFPGTQATAAIVSFSPRDEVHAISFSQARSTSDLDAASENAIAVPRSSLAARKWSKLSSPISTPQDKLSPRIGDYFKVSRGQVTGCNKVFVVGPGTPKLPERFKVPCVTGAEDLFGAADHYNCCLDDRTKLKRAVLLPADFSELEGDEFDMVRAFIDWAENQGAHQTFTAKTRKPWWRIPFHDPPPIIVTYMARRPPVFIRNLAGARLLNIAHGLRPKAVMEEEQIDDFVVRLNKASGQATGRTYAGGLVKFEPSDIADIEFMAAADLVSV